MGRKVSTKPSLLDSSPVDMRDSTKEPSFRLSPVQKVFEGSRFEPGEGLNIEQVVCTTTESLNLPAFRESWQEILDHHAVLRAGFRRDEKGEPVQEIHSPLEIPVVVEDQRSLDAAEREGFLDAWLEKDRQASFRLSAPPLMRVTVIRFADDLATWVWTFHHILLDGRSFMLVLDDFFQCYEAACAGKSVVLPERTPFSEFVTWHQNWLATHREEAAFFWREIFTNDETQAALSISRTSSPLDHRQAKIVLATEPGLTEKLQRFAQEFDLTSNTVVQGIWALLLSRYYRSRSVTFATIRACRQGSIEGAGDMVGLLMNFLPVHAHVSEEIPVIDFFKKIREQQLAVRPYQWTPWEVLRDAIPIAASKQLSDSCVLYERYNIAQELTDRFGNNSSRKFSLIERANIPLLLSVCERPVMQFELSYQTGVFAAKDARRLGRSFMGMLQQIIKMPGLTIEALRPREMGETSSRLDTGVRFPLSDIQQAYVIGRARRAGGTGGAHSYHEFETLGIDVVRLRTAWRRLIERHEMLRAHATEDGEGEILPVVPPFQIAVTDLTSSDPARQQRELTATREEMSHRSYDPFRWPLFDLRVTKLPANRCRLHFSFDLLMLDAAGVQRVLGELRGLYENPKQADVRSDSDFREHALEQQALRESAQLAGDQAYWEEKLPDMAARPSLPVARDPKGAEFSRFTRHSGLLPAQDWEKLRKGAEKIGLTPTALLATAFSDVLGKWCGQRKFTLNLALLQHDDTPAQKLPLGNYATATLLAVDLDAADFPARSAQLMTRLQSDVCHDLFSGIQVLRAMRKKQLLPDEYGMPVVMTSLITPQTTALQRTLSTSWLGDSVYEVSQSPNVWLDHQISERDGALVYHWDSVEGLFPAGLIDDMFSAYTDYLGSLVAGVSTGLAVRPPQLPATQQARRIAYNDTKAPFVSGLLHAGFFATAKKQPSEIAVDDPERQVTYGELADYANSIARNLHNAGVGPGDMVAIVMEKGWEQIAAVMGILRAGAAYLPIDPEMPKTRLEYLLSNGRVPVAITQSHLQSGISWPSTIKVWSLGPRPESTEPYDGPEPAPDSLAYVIYTSGSTGVPKGVMIAHQAALNTIVDINQRLGVTAKDRVLSVSALSFDLSVYDIFGMLEAGGAIVLPAPERARDPIHWVERMNECHVTIWNSAPALMQMLITILEASRGTLPANLRWTMLSGDWIPVDLPSRLRKYAPNNRLLSLGGATEVSIWSIAFPVDQVDATWTSIPYGMPMVNQTIHILDDRFEPCPEWTAGEIFIGGDGLAMGYLADEAKTTERFLKSPVSGEALYRTGDFGRFRSEGFVEFLGRKDTQVKIRGYRIEIGEIEAALLRLTGVREAAALTVSTTAGGRSGGILVGCVVLQKSSATPPDEDTFRAELATSLPSHMIPSRIIVLDELPLSANGKVDRRVLLEKVAPTLVSEDRGARDEPQDDLERSIWTIWKDILPDRRIGRHDRFYEIGGDSLSVLHMIMRVEKMVGRTIGLRPMQQGGTIVDLAAAARETGPVVPPPMMIGIHSGGTRPPLFFAHGDLATGGLYCQRMAHNLGPDQPLYVVSPHGASGGSLPSTYEEVGTSFVELIRSAQKKGPYYLGGFCNGALAMFEAAHQLIRSGETVAAIVLLDPPDLSLFLSRRKISRLGQKIGLPEGEGRDSYHRIAELMEIWQDHGAFRFVRDFWNRGLAFAAKTYRNFFKKEDPMRSMLSLETAYYEAMVRYECQVYTDPTWIILREGESHRHPRQIKYWSEFIPGAHYEVVPGTHLELTGNMDEIAGIIKKAIGQLPPR